MTSLGYRVRCDHNAERVPTSATVAIAALPEPAVAAPRRFSRLLAMPTRMPRGFLPLLLYAAAALLFPLLYLYASFDFSDDVVRALAVAAAGGLGLAVVFANDCCVWFNMALFFHTGVEAVVVDHTMTYIDLATTSDTGKALAWTGIGVVIAHLLPFFLLDRPRLLTLLALAGVPVNAALAVYTQPLPGSVELYYVFVTLSAAGLLLVTRIVLGVDAYAPSLLTKLRGALRDGSLLAC